MQVKNAATTNRHPYHIKKEGGRSRTQVEWLRFPRDKQSNMNQEIVTVTFPSCKFQRFYRPQRLHYGQCSELPG